MRKRMHPFSAADGLRLGVLGCVILLSACATPSDIESRAIALDAPALGLPDTSQKLVVADQWWREFGDAQLNRLIDLALAKNPNLQITRSRLARANAVFEVAQAANRPQVTASLDVTHQRFTQNGAVPPPLAGAILDSGTLQAGASWELDFFGKNSAALDAALGSAKAAQADEQAARGLLASQVARAYFQWLRIQDQLTLAQRTLNQREETLKLVQDRVNAGLDTRLELLQSEGSLPEARFQIEALQEQASLARNALAALTGSTSLNLALEPSSLSGVKKAAVAPAIPADLLGRRADISAARWRVEAATQDVSNARAQFYPNVNLVAFAGYSSIGLERLLETGSQQWGIGPAIRLPIFDGGRLRANLHARSADLDAAIESYNATVIEALHEVADQVASAQSIVQQQIQQASAQLAAEGAYTIAVQRYQAGLGTYLNVLSAETAVLNQRRTAVDLSARALDTQVALIRALGGAYLFNLQTAERSSP